MYPGSLEVLYHAEYFPAVMRVALDVLCGVLVLAVAHGGDIEPDPALEELGWGEVLGGEALSDSSSGVASATSSVISSPANSPR